MSSNSRATRNNMIWIREREVKGRRKEGEEERREGMSGGGTKEGEEKGRSRGSTVTNTRTFADPSQTSLGSGSEN